MKLGLYISLALCKTAVTPLVMHWSYCSHALSQGYAAYITTQAYPQLGNSFGDDL